SAPEASADRSLRSSLPGANRSERAWARSTAVEPTLLDTPPKVRHKRRSVKAVVFHEFGGPDVLKLEELPAPSPGPGEVLLDILACALNHLDVDVREGISRFPVEPPFVLGLDVVGRITAVGDGVEERQE